MTGRIPADWHEIAQKRLASGKEKVTLRLEGDVLKFFLSMGPDYGPRINDVLRSYMHAQLAGVVRGAETLAHYRRREEEGMDGPKPQFGDVAKVTGEAWADEAPQMLKAQMQEIRQQRFAAGEMTDWGEAVPWVR